MCAQHDLEHRPHSSRTPDSALSVYMAILELATRARLKAATLSERRDKAVERPARGYRSGLLNVTPKGLEEAL